MPDKIDWKIEGLLGPSSVLPWAQPLLALGSSLPERAVFGSQAGPQTPFALQREHEDQGMGADMQNLGLFAQPIGVGADRIGRMRLLELLMRQQNR